MRSQRATAKLRGGHDNFAAVGLQNANGRVVEFSECDLRDAAGKQRDASAALPASGKCFAEAREEKVAINARKKSGALLQTEKAQDSRRARDRFDSGALIETDESSDARDAARMGKQIAKHKITNGARKSRPLEIASDLRASKFHELAVFHSRRARRLASATVEAAVDVRDETFVQFEAALIDERHLANASARRIAFVVPQPICRTRVQAKAAVNAARVVRVFGLIAGGEAAEGFREFALRFFMRQWGHARHFVTGLRQNGPARKYCAGQRPA